MSLLKKLTFGLLVTALATAGAVFVQERAAAQRVDPLEGLGTDDDGTGPFGEGGDPFDLFHRAIQAPSIGQDEFGEQQQRAIDAEAQTFRQRQLELLGQPGSGVVDADEAPTVSEPSVGE